MQFTYSLTEKDFRESFAAHRNRKTFAKWAFRIFVVLFVAMVALGVADLVERPTFETFLTMGPLVCLMLFWLWIYWAAPWRGARKLFRGQPAAQGLKTVRVDDISVHIEWAGGSSDVAWTNYIGWTEAQNVILIYASPVTWGIIPKRALEATQLSEFRELLKRHVAAPSKMAEVVDPKKQIAQREKNPV